MSDPTFEQEMTLDSAILKVTDEHGFLAHRVLPDGRVLAVVPLTFARARLCLGGYMTYDEGW